MDRLHKHIFICVFVVKTPEGLSGVIQTANSFDIFLFPTNWQFLRGTEELKERSPLLRCVLLAVCRGCDNARGYGDDIWGHWKASDNPPDYSKVQWHARNKEPCRSCPAAQFLLLPAARWDYLSLGKCQGHDSLRCPAGNNPLLPSKQMKPHSGPTQGLSIEDGKPQTLYAFCNSLNKHQTCKHTHILTHTIYIYITSLGDEDKAIDQW